MIEEYTVVLVSWCLYSCFLNYKGHRVVNQKKNIGYYKVIWIPQGTTPPHVWKEPG